MRNSIFSDKVIEQTIVWIKSNIHDDLKISNVASKTGYSKWHLQRMFKAKTGESLGNYIRIEKLYHAARDLKINQGQILTVAVNYGFDSHQTFSRAFKKNLHCKPSECRRRNSCSLNSLTGPALCSACRVLYHLPSLNSIHRREHSK